MIPAAHKNQRGSWLNPVTLLIGEQGYLDVASHLGLLTCLGLTLLVSLLGLETQAELDLHKKNGPDHKERWHFTRAV